MVVTRKQARDALWRLPLCAGASRIAQPRDGSQFGTIIIIIR